MKTLVIGASKGLGKALMQGLGNPGDTLIGVARAIPPHVPAVAGIDTRWIEADLAHPAAAVATITEAVADQGIDTLIYNLGIWEPLAFDPAYDFLDDHDAQIETMIGCNITATILLIKRLLPLLLQSQHPRILLTGSTSGLPRSGRPEVTFGASKFALQGIADALREGYRDRRLGVTCLNLGYLNTEDGLEVPVADAAQRGEGALIPVHDVVQVVRMVLSLSPASFVRELSLPAILDDRF